MTAWYRTGTVTATNGSGTVTGALTAWLANAKVGDAFTFDADSKVYEITAVGGNTSITISPVYAGTTGGSKAYGINRTSTAWNDASQLALDIANFIASYDPLGLSQLSDPNADRVPFWDDSASAMAWLTLSGLGISGTTMSVDTDLISTARWTTATLTAATTTDIGGQTSPIVTVSGNTGITSLGNQPNRLRIVRFTGTPTITHNGTTLILPGSANLTVVSGSVHVFASDASGNWRWMWSNELTTITTAAGRAILDDADASAQLTTLGVSTYAKTLLDDADASTALSTLGVSTYAKTILDDTSAGAALTTLGVSSYAQTLLDDTSAAVAQVTIGVKLINNVAMSDDTAQSVNFGGTAFGLLFVFSSTALAAIVHFRAASTPSCTVLGTTIGTVNTYTTALAGTTGADASLNVAATAAGVVYIENRQGSPFTCNLFALKN